MPSAVPEKPKHRTFHEHGASEIRVTVLAGEERVDIHVLDVEGVIHKGGILADAVLAFLEFAGEHADTTKITVTPAGVEVGAPEDEEDDD